MERTCCSFEYAWEVVQQLNAHRKIFYLNEFYLNNNNNNNGGGASKSIKK